MGHFDLRLDHNVDHIVSRARPGHMTLIELHRVHVEEKAFTKLAPLGPLLGLFAFGFGAVSLLFYVFA